MFVGDSLIKGLTEDMGLDITGWKRGWTTRMKRGGTTEMIKNLIRKEDLLCTRWTVICAG